MINSKDYYIAPSQEIFDDIKQASIKVWQTYDNEFRYVDEKVNAIKDFENVRDNYAYMVAMFDMFNQHKVLKLLELPESKSLVESLIS